MNEKMLDNVTKVVTKTEGHNSAIKMLPGFVATVRIRCGKLNCRCARGDRHVAHYHVTYCYGARSRRYVRRDQLSELLAACEAHRKLQARLRVGRAEYKESLAQTRKLVKLIDSE
jgi:hypothetical protein